MGSNNNKSIRKQKTSIPITFIPSLYFNNSHPMVTLNLVITLNHILLKSYTPTRQSPISPAFNPTTYLDYHQGIPNLSHVCMFPICPLVFTFFLFLSQLPGRSAQSLLCIVVQPWRNCLSLHISNITYPCSLTPSGPSKLLSLIISYSHFHQELFQNLYCLLKYNI